MKQGHTLYDSSFYKPHTSRKGYIYLGSFLFDVFDPENAVDFGCGIGETLSRLEAKGVRCYGLEGSEDALQFSKVKMAIADLGEPIHLNKQYDLVISTEVAEHLRSGNADAFVDNLVRHAKSAVFFTAAVPGQGGVGHVNEQPKAYWREKFERRGLRRVRLIEFIARIALYPLIWEMPWIRNNLQVFVKGKPNRSVGRAFMYLPRYMLQSLRWRLSISRLGGGLYWIPKRDNKA